MFMLRHHRKAVAKRRLVARQVSNVVVSLDGSNRRVTVNSYGSGAPSAWNLALLRTKRDEFARVVAEARDPVIAEELRQLTLIYATLIEDLESTPTALPVNS
jgi:hypothetical protein